LKQQLLTFANSLEYQSQKLIDKTTQIFLKFFDVTFCVSTIHNPYFSVAVPNVFSGRHFCFTQTKMLRMHPAGAGGHAGPPLPVPSIMLITDIFGLWDKGNSIYL